MSRLPEQPGERIERQKLVTFTFDGKKVQGYEGDTVGSALYAAGQRTFSRSFKYHRRRGLMCVAGSVPELHLLGRRRPGRPGVHRAGPRGDGGQARQRAAVAGARRDARHRPVRRPVHAARLLLQDVHPPAQAVAAVREDPAQRGRAGQAARAPGRARVADRVPPPPRRRARRRRRDRRPERGDRGRRTGRRRGARRRGRRARRPAADRVRSRSRCASWPSGPATPASRSSTAPRRSATSTG